jgi:hypothetical protein
MNTILNNLESIAVGTGLVGFFMAVIYILSVLIAGGAN